MTAWLALTPSTPENGGMRMMPGSNHCILAHRDNGDSRNMLGRREEVIADVDEATRSTSPSLPAKCRCTTR